MNCETCGGTGYVFIRKTGDAFPNIQYWMLYRCACDSTTPGQWKVTGKDGKSQMVTGPRKMDRTIKTYAEDCVPRSEVFSAAARLKIEHEEWQAAQERAAIQAEGKPIR